MKLKNYVAGQWHEGTGDGVPLINPSNGKTVAHAGSEGVDLRAALDYSRKTGGAALRTLSYEERAECLDRAAAVLFEQREKYHDIARQNSGNTAIDAAIDVDGGIGTLKFFSGLGKKLGSARYMAESDLARLARDKSFQALHILTPREGVAIHINAFNFPSWGLWEKAAVALLSGVPVFAKPATSTCWLTHEMVQDVVAADVLPKGSLSVLCGGGHDLLDNVAPSDMVFFTGSADTANYLKSNERIVANGVPFNTEADSLNLTLLGADVDAATPLFAAFVKEIRKEMTVKAGQKCTAIRRILVPAAIIDDVADALSAQLNKVVVGDPNDDSVRMGPVVNKAQQRAAFEGIELLKSEASVVCGDGADFAPVCDEPEQGCFVQPTLLRCDDPSAAKRIHDTEVFGPVATVLPYRSTAEALEIAGKGGGSLAASVFSNDADILNAMSLGLAPSHGRVLAVNDRISESHTGHGIVMPQCTHGGPGRAGGGEELGGLRGLRAYHQRTAIQGDVEQLEALQATAAPAG